MALEVDVVHDAVRADGINDRLLIVIGNVAGHARLQPEDVTRLSHSDRHSPVFISPMTTSDSQNGFPSRLALYNSSRFGR